MRILAEEHVTDQGALAIASWVALVPLLVRTLLPPNRMTESIASAQPYPSAASREERILVLAPETDGEVVAAAAAEGGFSVQRVADMASLRTTIDEGAGAVVLVDGEVSPADVATLNETLRAQPTWSELPLLLVAADAEQQAARQRMRRLVEVLQPVGDVRLLERPLESWMLAVRFSSALQARRRQYATRARIEQSDLERRRELTVLAALPVGILVVDRTGRALQSNAAMQRIWGALPVMQSLEDVRVFRARSASAGGEDRLFDWRFARVLATGQAVIEEELEIEAFDAVRRTVLSSALPIRDTAGEVVGAVAVQVDITERARAQRARQVLSEATAALGESLDVGVTLRTLSRIVVTRLADCCAIDEMDEHGELRRLVAETTGARGADEAARLLAYAPTASGNSLATRVLKSERPFLLSDVWSDWRQTGLEADAHRDAFTKIGACSMMVVPLIAGGVRLGVLGIVSTHSERCYDARDLALAEEIARRAAMALDKARVHRQAEAALRARDEVLAEVDAFINASPVGFALLDRDLRYRRVNPCIAHFYGRAQDEVLGRTLEEIVPPAYEAQLAPMLNSVLRTGEGLLGQPIAGDDPRQPGKTVHRIDSVMPVLDVEGSPRAVGVIVQDVTRLKEAEKALRDEAAFRERFIGVVAHDLRNPLAAVALSASSLLRKGDAPEHLARPLGRIARAASRMERMVGNLLDLVRAREGGGIGVARKPTDLADVVREVVGDLEASHPGRHISVSHEGDTRAELDPDRMAEVVSNLAGNALAYSPHETVVGVDVRSRDGELALAVHNAGTPIPTETLQRIFTPFKRGAAPECGPTAMRGLGLGLFIVAEITREHGGTIAVSSTASEGTTFTVRLPRTGQMGAALPPP